MDAARRKAAIADYKERKAAAGIYAVRCAASGEVWVGESRHLDTQQTGLWFALRLGSSHNRAMQAAWAAHGGDSFSFEELERLPEGDERSAYMTATALKERGSAWRERLGAGKV